MIELIIAMTLTVVAVSMSVSFISMVSRFSNIQQSDALSMTERQHVLSMIDAFSDTFSVNSWQLQSVSTYDIVVSDGENDYSLHFDIDTHTLSSFTRQGGGILPNSRTFEKIVDVAFKRSGDLVLVTMSFVNFPQQKYLADFGVIA